MNINRRPSQLSVCRIRGYQGQSQGRGEPKKNPPAYRSLGDRRGRPVRPEAPSPEADAVDLEQVGFAEIFETHEQ